MKLPGVLALIAVAVCAPLTIQIPIAQATSPGSNGKIVFSRPAGSGGEGPLFTADADGTHVVQVNDLPSYCTEWSPDGREIAFSFFDQDGNNFIATMNADGSSLRVLREGECSSWSPDQSELVYDYGDPGAAVFSTALWVMNADGSDTHPLMSPSLSGFDVEPRWQPTGNLIAFTRIRKASTGIQQEALFVVNADGTNPRQLTPWGFAEEHATWSPDGQWLIFNDSSGSASAHESIWTVRTDGSQRHKLFQGTSNTGGVKPQFSPDGTRVLFVCVQYGSAFGRGHTEDLCTMNADGTHVTDITNSPASFENWPSWGSAPSS